MAVVKESTTKITQKETKSRTIDTENLIIAKTGSVTVKTSTGAGGDEIVYAVRMTNTEDPLTATLNGNLSVTDKTSDSYATYGLYLDNEATLSTDNASKISVTRTVTKKESDIFVYGIDDCEGALSFKSDGGKFLDAVTVTLENAQKDILATAYGILGYSNINFYDELAAEIKVTAKTTAAAGDSSSFTTASALSSGGNMAFKAGITKGISASATSKATIADAYAISGNTLAIDPTAAGKAVSGNISATASGANAYARAISFSSIDIDGDVSGNITATATSTKTSTGGESEYQTTAFGIYAHGGDEVVGLVSLDGTLAGSVTAKATGTVAEAMASALQGTTLTIGTEGKTQKAITGNISATATSSSACAESQTAMANTIIINGDVTGNITSSATSKTTASSSEEAAGTYAFGFNAYYNPESESSDNGLLKITGALSGTVTATATAKNLTAEASAVNGSTVQIANGITKAVTATATSTGSAAWALGIDSTLLAIGTEGTTTKAIANNISAKATGLDETEAVALQYYDSALINGSITGSITAEATSKGEGDTGEYNSTAYGIFGYCVYGGSEEESSYGNLTLNGALSGAVNAKATSKKISANATALYGRNAIITDGISKSITATATSTDNSAEAKGFDFSTLTINKNGITGSVSATASGTDDVEACAVDAHVKIAGTISGSITAKATSTSASGDDTESGSSAYAFKGDELSADAISGAVKATAVSKKLSAESYLVYGKNVEIKNGISNSWTSSAEAKGFVAAAYGFSGSDVTIGSESTKNAITGAISATAKNTAGVANAYTVTLFAEDAADFTVNGNMTKNITATAASTASIVTTEEETSGIGGAEAAAISATNINFNGAEETVKKVTVKNAIAGSITATATGNSVLSSKKTEAVSAYAAAYALQATNDILVDGNITKDISATATANSVTLKNKCVVGGSATAVAVSADHVIDINGKLSGAVKATATSKAAEASATAISGDLSVADGIANSISATASGAASTVQAYAIDNTTTTLGTAESTATAIAGNITATATGNAVLAEIEDGVSYSYASAEAYALNAKSTLIANGAITKGITATATANSFKNADGFAESGTAAAYGIKSESVNLGGVLSGAVKATATAKGSSADAMAFSTTLLQTGDITNAISASATAAASDATATAIGASDLQTGAIKGDITATATGNASLNTTKTGSIFSSAKAVAIEADQAKVNGDITKGITATATANTVTLNKVVYGGTAEAIGIDFGESGFDVEGDIKGTIKATATGKGESVNAYGIQGEGTLSVKSNIGTVNVTANGSSTGKNEAYGWSVDSINYSGDLLTGKATVTCKTGEAIGLFVGKIIHDDSESESDACTATLNIASTGYAAFGIEFTSSANLTLKNSTVTTKSTASDSPAAFAFYDAGSLEDEPAAQLITLDKSTVTGAVSLDLGTDLLGLTNQSKLTGNVAMGAGADCLCLIGNSTLTGSVDMGTSSGEEETPDTDMLVIHSGSLIKGDVSNVEEAYLSLDSTSTSALWEGTDFDAESIILDVESDALTKVTKKKSQTFNLLKDTKDCEWVANETSVTLNFGGEQETLYYKGAAVELGGYSFKLTESTSKKTTTMQLAVSKLS